MGKQIRAIVEDDDTVIIDGKTITQQADFAATIKTALQADPDSVLVIQPRRSDYYKGIGKLIYASQAAGMPVENLRYAVEDGDELTFAELRARLSGA
jgi:hypothetical protein